MDNVIDIRKEFESYWNQMEAFHGCERTNVVIGGWPPRELSTFSFLCTFDPSGLIDKSKELGIKPFISMQIVYHLVSSLHWSEPQGLLRPPPNRPPTPDRNC